jgi:hypothetical protein
MWDMSRIANTTLEVFPLNLGGNVFGWTADETESVANAFSRPWEPHKYLSKEAQDANLEMLMGWIRAYEDKFECAAAWRESTRSAGAESGSGRGDLAFPRALRQSVT